MAQILYTAVTADGREETAFVDAFEWHCASCLAVLGDIEGAMRRGVVLVVAFLVACASAPATPDASTALDAPAGADAPPPGDALASDATDCIGTTHWLERGVCFEAPRCCAPADCPPGWGCTAEGRCVDPARLCGCLSDTDCSTPPSTVCVTNDAVCGACVVLPDACPRGDPDCAASATCLDGACLERTSPCLRAP